MSIADKQPSPKYAGWVPTVAGRLSFRHIGESRFPTPSAYANVTTKSTRVILAVQRRSLSDALFPRITDRFTTHTGDFWFVLRAENASGGDAGDNVTGTVYIFRADSWPTAKTSIQKSISSLNRLRLSAQDDRDAEVLAVHNRTRDVLNGNADISVEFKLHRTGEAYFSEAACLDPEVQKASIEHALKARQDFLKWMADHGYFFLRDLCHQHQHHDQTEDTILVLQPADVEDAKWREKVIYSLYFRIIRAKRSDHYPHAARALGILAYCRSFKKISKAKFQSADVPLPAYNDAALRASLKARISEDKSLHQQEETNALNQATSSTNVRVIALTAILIVLAIFAIFADDVSRANQNLAHHLQILLVPTLQAAGLVLVLIWATTSKVVLRWTSVLELSNVYRGRTMQVYFVIALVLLLVALLLASGFLTTIWSELGHQAGTGARH